MAGSQDRGSVLFCPPSVFGEDRREDGRCGVPSGRDQQGGTADIHAWAPGQVVKLLLADRGYGADWVSKEHGRTFRRSEIAKTRSASCLSSRYNSVWFSADFIDSKYTLDDDPANITMRARMYSCHGADPAR